MKILVVLTVLIFSTRKVFSENEETPLIFNSFKELNITEFLYEIADNLTLHSVDYNETLCGHQLLYWLGVLAADQEIWALKMYDSWGSIPSGILSGSFYNFGNFDECLSINRNTESDMIGTIKGQYCLQPITLPNFNRTHVRLLGNMPNLPSTPSLVIGICVPDQCSPEIIKNVADAVLKELKLPINEYDPNQMCQTYDKIYETTFEWIDYFTIAIFSMFLLIVISSTAYDLIMKFYSKTAPKLILISFSVYSNCRRLFAMKKSDSSDVLECLNGIRVLSIIWVIFGHAYLTRVAVPLINMSDLLEWVKHPQSMLLLSATVSVDTFFTISGILVTWSVLKELKKNSKLNIPLMYIHRYLRLTPAFAALILFSVSLVRYIGSGPLWPEGTNFALVRNCEKYWWSALLYIQNYVNPDEMCLGHSWYLSVDMQLFILSPIILYPLWKWGKKFIWVVPVLAFLSMACSFSTFLTEHFTLNVINGGGITNSTKMRLIYYPTHTRMGAWLIGVICGYLLHIYKDTKIILSKIVITTGWIISLATILAIIFGQYNIQQTNHKSNEIEDAFYDSCSRVGWAIAVSWIIFACVQGYGGCVNWFLSLKEWQPLGRLSYCMYLTHLVIQVNMLSEVRTTSYFSDISTVHSLWGDFGYTLTIATAWCLFFESPITVIEKVLFKKCGPIRIQHPLIGSTSSHVGNDSETITVEPAEDLTIQVSSRENLIEPDSEDEEVGDALAVVQVLPNDELIEPFDREDGVEVGDGLVVQIVPNDDLNIASESVEEEPVHRENIV